MPRAVLIILCWASHTRLRQVTLEKGQYLDPINDERTIKALPSHVLVSALARTSPVPMHASTCTHEWRHLHNCTAMSTPLEPLHSNEHTIGATAQQ